MTSVRIGGTWLAASALAIAIAASAPAFATTLYSQGFETDTTDWTSGVTRVASGTNGITAASGAYYGQTPKNSDDYSHWGTTNASTGGAPGAFQPYTTSIKIYLDVGTSAANDTRFDFSSAINKPDGSFLRDFVFNVGFYSDGTTGPGAGNDRFVVSTGNNAGRGNSYPSDPGHDPIAIETTGWYTFQDTFLDNGGVLNVQMEILDASDNVVGSWVLGSDPITDAGGSRYGWFVSNEFDMLAIDDVSLTTQTAATPLPATLPLLAGGLAGLGFLRRRKMRAN